MLVIEDVDKPMAEGIVPIVTLFGIQPMLAWIMFKSQIVRRLFDGAPSDIIRGGKLDRREMKQQR